jgi:hypothetical protein
MSAVEYRVYCNHEEDFFNVILSDGLAPTVCPNNNTHSIDGSKTYITKSYDPKVVSIREETTPTQGNHLIKGYDYIINAGINVVTVHDFQFNRPVSVLSLCITADSTQVNDILNVVAAPFTTIGLVISDLLIGGNTITVSPTVIAALNSGYYVRLTNGTNIQDFGEVLSIDPLTSQVTLEDESIYNFLGTSTMVFVQMTIPRLINFIIRTPGLIPFGNKKIGGTYIPNGTILRISYTNKSILAKTLSFVIEHLY